SPARISHPALFEKYLGGPARRPPGTHARHTRIAACQSCLPLGKVLLDFRPCLFSEGLSLAAHAG
ncbi:MAG: hypothetical protein DWG76_04360, partial [Chloroflexi bacterium]|nr:hypothetical protein [Chloroflexota bacterium]